MTPLAARLSLVVAIAAFAGCSSDDDLPLEDAERARGLRFRQVPAVVHEDRDRYLRAVAAEAQAISDEDVAAYRAVWGRLGYFAPDFDVRSAFAGRAKLVGAFYDETSKVITVFDEPAPNVLVHELVHALQDQHFDLRAIGRTKRTTDEQLAQAAFVEGDAELAERRFGLASRGRDDLSGAAAAVDATAAAALAQRVLERGGVPPLFVARPSFAYGYGEVYVAHVAGLAGTPPRWDTAAIDARFRQGGPRSSQEVLHPEVEPDPIEDLGPFTMPPGLVGRIEVRDVDTLGEWYVFLLLDHELDDASALAARWDGDRLTTLGAPGESVPRAVVWTTAWDDATAAAVFEGRLRTLHGTATEPVWIERRDAHVVFAAGLETDDLQALATAALDAPNQVQSRR